MARRSRGRRSTSGRRPNYLWTGQSTTAEQTVAAAAVTAIVIVAPADYQASTTATTEAGGTTLLRIRAGLDIRATVAGAALYVSIVRKGSNEAAPNPNSAAAIIDGDTLWYGIYMVPIDTVRHIDIDVKVKRRLEDDQIVMNVQALAQTVTYLMWARALLLGAK